MISFIKFLCLLVFGVLLAPNSSMAGKPISAGVLTDDQLLTVMRQTSKERQNIHLDSYIELGDGHEDAFDENNRDCGNVEIGNVESGGFGRPRPQLDVVVVGDVINLADDC